MKDLADVNGALMQIGDFQRRIRRMNDKINAEFARITAETEVQIAPLMAQIQALEGGMKVYAETNREAIFGKKGKTRKLDYGEISYRVSTKIAITKATLGLLIEGRYDEAINVKKTVDKEELENWTDAELKAIKARRDVEDVFGYKLKEEAIKDKKLVA
jgi:phage host-nuclease inhibitor protein Gam